MILNTKEFKETAATILAAIDTSEVSVLNDSLELNAVNNTLYLNVTNQKYYASVKFGLDHDENMHVTIEANKFLKLVAAFTTSTIELSAKENYLLVKADGTYKVPYTDTSLAPITIDNVTKEMDISGELLNSILQYNSKELQKTSFSDPVQKLYYIDQEGCITFTRGACVNSFTLPEPIKMQIDDRLVKLFKLFKNDTVHFKLGYDPMAGSTTINQLKVSFETANIKLTAITPSTDASLNRVPVNRLRNMATRAYENTMVVNREQFLQAVSRLLLFNVDDEFVAKFTCDERGMEISVGDNNEAVTAQNGSTTNETYVMQLRLDMLKQVLSSCIEPFITINYGNNMAITITRGRICNVIPEVAED